MINNFKTKNPKNILLIFLEIKMIVSLILSVTVHPQKERAEFSF